MPDPTRPPDARCRARDLGIRLGRYKPGTTIVVDKGEEAGLAIQAADEKTPAAVEV